MIGASPKESVMAGISRRAEQLGTENAFVVLAEVAELQRQGRSILSFCIGQPDFVTPDEIREAGIKAIRDGKTGYTPSPGIPELRLAVAREFAATRGLDARPEDVVIAAGAKPFIGFTIQSVTDHGAGDEVIFPVPGFPIYESQVRAQGAVPIALPLRDARGFAFDPDDLARRITPRTKLVILNSPHNPTGGILDRSVLRDVAAILRAHEQVWIYSDEPYSRLVYDEPFVSIASEPGMEQRTIVVDGVSKTWAMPGWRIGWAMNRTLAPLFTRWMANTESCAGHMNQYAALAALTGSQDAANSMRDEFHARRDLIVGLLNGCPGVRCQVPAGAFYVWPDVTLACLRVGAKDSEELRRRLLHEAGVAVLSDIHFGPRIPGEGQHVRFSYAASRAAIEEGIGRMKAFLERNAK